MDIKYSVYDWCHECTKQLEALELEHGKEYIGDPFRMAEALFDLGINVMIYRVPIGIGKCKNPNGGQVTLFVDTKRFHQR
jgi:hypothetical protein